MTEKEFARKTICTFSESVFYRAKKMLLENKYITFFVFDKKYVNKYVLGEKVCDYFFSLYNDGYGIPTTFQKCLESYIEKMDSVIKPYIIQSIQSDSKNTITLRAKKYYDTAVSIKNMGSEKLSMEHLIDYTRIMMCLYSSIINNNKKPIDNFNYAIDCINTETIVESLAKEEKRKKLVFSSDSMWTQGKGKGTLIISILLLFEIENLRLEVGGNDE